MTKRQFWKIRKNWKHRPSTPVFPVHTGCPGSMAKRLRRTGDLPTSQNMANSQNFATPQNLINSQNKPVSPGNSPDFYNNNNQNNASPVSQLQQWPVQIKLVPINAPYFDGADLLIAADCTAYVYANFHQDFIKGKITLIGCPKLDSVDYSQKLTEIIKQNNIRSVTIVRMEVPCCGGLQQAAIKAMKDSGKFLPWQVYTISTTGEILS